MWSLPYNFISSNVFPNYMRHGTCSIINGPTSYTFNDNYSMEKYVLRLEGSNILVDFEVNICTEVEYTNIDYLKNEVLVQIPTVYWYALRIISENGNGIQFLPSRYFSTATAYGGREYIDTQSSDIDVIIHEIGHTIEQSFRLGIQNGPHKYNGVRTLLNPIWQDAIESDNIITSLYGQNNWWEDYAEFCKFYAYALSSNYIYNISNISTIRSLSPLRSSYFEFCLSKVIPYYYYLYPTTPTRNINIITSFPINSFNLKFDNCIISANDISVERRILNINRFTQL